MAVGFESSYNGEKLFVMDGVVLFGRCEGFRVVSNSAGFPAVVELYEYRAQRIIGSVNVEKVGLGGVWLSEVGVIE